MVSTGGKTAQAVSAMDISRPYKKYN